MFGTKRREKNIEAFVNKTLKQNAVTLSHRPTMAGATQEVLSSATSLLLRSPGAKIDGNREQCAISLMKEYTEEDIIKHWIVIKNTFGVQYECSISVSAKCPTVATQMRNSLSPGWRNHADEEMRVYHTFSSIGELKRWISGSGGITNSRRYTINLQDRMSLEKR